MPSIRVEIYDQSYPIAGGNERQVRELAARVDAKMRQVARETNVVDSLRVAVLAAINLADENEGLRQRARALERSLDRLLQKAG